jgi:hypothetical protein
MLSGWISLERGDARVAAESFRLVQRLDPDRAALDADQHPPRLVRAYASALAERSAAPTGTVTPRVHPPTAVVWVDGRSAADATAEIHRIEPGDHYLTAAAPGFSPRSQRVRVPIRGAAVFAVRLEPLPPLDAIRSIRAALVGLEPRLPADLAARLAAAAGADRLILVRQAATGAIEIADYDSRTGLVGTWRRPGAHAGSPRAAGRAAPTPEATAPARDGASLSWYRTGWGKVAIAAVGVVAIAGATTAIIMADRDDGVTIGSPWGFAP